MSDAVLVTGAFGMVGTQTVKRLAADGRRVVATDLDTPANRSAAEKLPAGVQMRYADLTDPKAVDTLVSDVAPAAIIHLAAIIPPFCYARRGLARKVNVGATASLLAAAARHPAPPRFVQASSIAVYGARNPHKISDVLTAETPVNPTDIYGQHKVETEALVRASGLDWLILRLGGVLTSEPGFGMDRDLLFFEGVLPADGRLQTVDVRDVASAFAAATTVDVTGRVLLIGGDDSHRQLQGEIARDTTAAMGVGQLTPTGRPGNPDSDTDWFATDWMDSATAQEILGHQHHSWPQTLADTAAFIGWKRWPMLLAAPLARFYFTKNNVYQGVPGPYADIWNTIRGKWGEPGPDGDTK
ncbi:MAG: NAD(P)-dependent oxidoreductase [Mycobacterium sp.]